jgi:hypothetical protein
MAPYHTLLHTNKTAIERNKIYIRPQNKKAKLINVLRKLRSDHRHCIELLEK